MKDLKMTTQELKVFFFLFTNMSNLFDIYCVSIYVINSGCFTTTKISALSSRIDDDIRLDGKIKSPFHVIDLMDEDVLHKNALRKF